MILIDTSLWIAWLRKIEKIPEARENFVTCGPILQEVIQGLGRDVPGMRMREGLLALPQLSMPLAENLFLEAADLYFFGRKKGYSIRSSYDCLIAAIAIRNSIPVAHRDRDFDFIAKYSALEVSSL